MNAYVSDLVTRKAPNKTMTPHKPNRKLTLLFMMLSILWTTLLFAESSQPPAKLMGEVIGLDKLAHFTAFGVLALLLTGTSFFSLRNKQRILLAPLLGTVIIGASEEIYQSTIEGRSGSILDLMADTSGAMFSVALIHYIFLTNPSIESNKKHFRRLILERLNIINTTKSS